MAKKSMIAKNKQRQQIVARYAEKRAELKKALVDPNGTDESREEVRPWTAEKLPRRRFALYAFAAATLSTAAHVV